MIVLSDCYVLCRESDIDDISKISGSCYLACPYDRATGSLFIIVAGHPAQWRIFLASRDIRHPARRGHAQLQQSGISTKSCDITVNFDCAIFVRMPEQIDSVTTSAFEPVHQGQPPPLPVLYQRSSEHDGIVQAQIIFVAARLDITLAVDLEPLASCSRMLH